jgi:hypothetical protein
MSYSNPTNTTYRFTAASLIASATLGRIIGPAGMTGRLLDIGYALTTGVTVAASSIRVGSVGTTNAYGTLAVPIAAIDTVGNTMVRGATIDIPKDTAVLIGSGGGATAGAADIIVTIDWY